MIKIPLETIRVICREDIELNLNMKEGKAICRYNNACVLINLLHIPFEVEDTKELKDRYKDSCRHWVRLWVRLIANNYVACLFHRYYPDTNELVWERIKITYVIKI